MRRLGLRRGCLSPAAADGAAVGFGPGLECRRRL